MSTSDEPRRTFSCLPFLGGANNNRDTGGCLVRAPQPNSEAAPLAVRPPPRGGPSPHRRRTITQTMTFRRQTLTTNGAINIARFSAPSPPSAREVEACATLAKGPHTPSTPRERGEVAATWAGISPKRAEETDMRRRRGKSQRPYYTLAREILSSGRGWQEECFRLSFLFDFARVDIFPILRLHSPSPRRSGGNYLPDTSFPCLPHRRSLLRIQSSLTVFYITE